MTEPNKPVSTGAAIGVGILCVFIAMFICGMGTMVYTSVKFGVTGYSTGSWLCIIGGIVCGAMYKDDGKLGKAIGVAVAIGAVVCIVALSVSGALG